MLNIFRRDLITMKLTPEDCHIIRVALTKFRNETLNAGEGLIKIGSSLIPFINKFPKNTELYRLMTTKFLEQ